MRSTTVTASSAGSGGITLNWRAYDGRVSCDCLNEDQSLCLCLLSYFLAAMYRVWVVGRCSLCSDNCVTSDFNHESTHCKGMQKRPSDKKYGTDILHNMRFSLRCFKIMSIWQNYWPWTIIFDFFSINQAPGLCWSSYNCPMATSVHLPYVYNILTVYHSLSSDRLTMQVLST